MARLLIHFTPRDVVRTRVVAGADALWELVLSLHRLQRRRTPGGRGPAVPAEVAQWRSNALAALSGQCVGRQVRDHLLPLVPIASYFPDFLTPHAGLQGLEPGVDAVLSTSRRQFGRELDKLTTRCGAPGWGAGLARGDLQSLHVLGSTLRGYFGTALAPVWPAVRARMLTEHTRLAGIRAASGVDAMLSGLLPAAVWHPDDRVLKPPTRSR